MQMVILRMHLLVSQRPWDHGDELKARPRLAEANGVHDANPLSIECATHIEDWINFNQLAFAAYLWLGLTPAPGNLR